jgi:hypothetical protein
MRHHSNSFCVRINWQHFAVNCREHTTWKGPDITAWNSLTANRELAKI